MSNFLNNLIKIGIGFALATSLYGSAFAQETDKDDKKESNIEVNWGYNALEAAVMQDGNTRERILTNLDVTVLDFKLGYNGLNELDNADPSTHFGRQRLFFGKKDSKTYALVDFRTNRDGIFAPGAGIRDTSLVEKLGGYGFVDATASKKGVYFDIFYGRQFGRMYQFEFTQAIDKPFKDNPTQFTELQGYLLLGHNLFVFGRSETNNFKFRPSILSAGVGMYF